MSIRSMLAKFPGLRAAYHALPSYKAKALRREQEHEQERRALIKLNERLFREVFCNDLTVRHGPFAGMRYLSEANGSQVLPKILGSYEEPVHSWIEEIISSKTYDLILDVGCAEGYYAVGFALRLPNLRVKAFDINPQARALARELAELNYVGNRVSFDSECSFQHLQQFGGPTTLVFCDIEGAEDSLLDPVKAPKLRECAILVEAHDVFVEGVSDRLLERFAESHRLRMVVDYPGRLADYHLPNDDQLSAGDRARLTDEVRLPAMRFFFLEPLLSLAHKSRRGTISFERVEAEGRCGTNTKIDEG
jgi:predicted O-methyltransferase YrrM